MLLKTNHTLDILPKKESFLLHISIFQIHFFIPPSIFLSFFIQFLPFELQCYFFMNTHHLKFENWDFADDINEKKNDDDDHLWKKNKKKTLELCWKYIYLSILCRNKKYHCKVDEEYLHTLQSQGLPSKGK